MPIHSFSTKPNTDDDKFIQKIKDECKHNMINFSAYVIEAIKKACNDKR